MFEKLSLTEMDEDHCGLKVEYRFYEHMLEVRVEPIKKFSLHRYILKIENPLPHNTLQY